MLSYKLSGAKLKPNTGCAKRSANACCTQGGAAKSISATHSGITSARPNLAKRPSYFSQCGFSRRVGVSKLNVLATITLPFVCIQFQDSLLGPLSFNSCLGGSV